jgi:hypothetical protein
MALWYWVWSLLPLLQRSAQRSTTLCGKIRWHVCLVRRMVRTLLAWNSRHSAFYGLGWYLHLLKAMTGVIITSRSKAFRTSSYAAIHGYKQDKNTLQGG